MNKPLILEIIAYPFLILFIPIIFSIEVIRGAWKIAGDVVFKFIYNYERPVRVRE